MGAIVLGLALALALVAALDLPSPGVSAPPISGADAPPDDGDTLRRCRTVTEADATCEAAWEARRRHFFGSEKSKT
ncbi:putative entry exclusion protein TrbK-alt [Sphingopyxis panaciterrae]